MRNPIEMLTVFLFIIIYQVFWSCEPSFKYAAIGALYRNSLKSHVFILLNKDESKWNT